jgi:hypothetical protein
MIHMPSSCPPCGWDGFEIRRYPGGFFKYLRLGGPCIITGFVAGQDRAMTSWSQAIHDGIGNIVILGAGDGHEEFSIPGPGRLRFLEVDHAGDA